MEKYEVTILQEQDGNRIDSMLASLLEESSRTYIQKLIELGNVCLLKSNNPKYKTGIISSKKQKVTAGDIIEVSIPEPKILDATPENIPLEILYEDECLLIVNKPKGMVVHPAHGNESGTLVNALMYHCQSLSSINGVIRPGIVHRIDKDTSGLLVVAKTDAAHRSLAKQLKEHTMHRRYHAIVYNNFTDDEGIIHAPIGRDPKNRLRMAVTENNSKEAITHYSVLQRFGSLTYIEARLETGRTHQIRVHMAYVNHPLLGDRLYGPKNKVLGAESQVLHAKSLGFIHPLTGENLVFESELPDFFQNILKKLNSSG